MFAFRYQDNSARLIVSWKSGPWVPSIHLFSTAFPFWGHEGPIPAAFRRETGYTLEMSGAHQAGQPLGPKYSYLNYFERTIVNSHFLLSITTEIIWSSNDQLSMNVPHELLWSCRCAPLLSHNCGRGWVCFYVLRYLSADWGTLTPHTKMKDLWSHSYHSESAQVLSCPSPRSRQKQYSLWESTVILSSG